MNRHHRFTGFLCFAFIADIFWIQISLAQRVFAEAPVTIENGIIRSRMVTVAFNREVIGVPRGTKTVDTTKFPIKDKLFLTILSQLSEKYGAVLIRKEVPGAVWGDTMVVNKRNNALVRQHDMSQIFAIEFARPVPVDSVLEIFARIPAVKYVEPPMFVEFQYTPDDSAYSTQWNLAKIQASLAWDITKGSNTVVLCDIEEYGSITMRNVPDFANLDGSNQFLDGYGYGGSGHALGVISIMGAATDNGIGLAGVGYHCRLGNETFTDPGSNGQSIADAISHAWQQVNANVINCSFVTKKATPPSAKLCPYSFQSVEDIIDNVTQAGVIVVAAGGNYQDLCPCDPIHYLAYPAWYDNVIGVAGIDQSDHYIPSYNNGLGIDVAAPSEAIPLLLSGGQISSESGTSCAAPHVTALVGLILSLNNSLTVTEVTDIIENSADEVDQTSHQYVDGRNDYLGYGRVNAYNAVRYTIEHYSTTIGGAGTTVVLHENFTTLIGTTLTIAPGTTVQMDPGVSLTINGQLLANGNSSQPITFTSTGNTSPGSWGNIVLSGSGANGSTIQYASIQYGTEIDVLNTSSVIIQNCTISNNSGDGLHFYNSSGCLANNNTIANSNAGNGIYIQGGSNNNCYGNVIYKANHNKQGTGIYYLGSSGTVGENDVDYFNLGIACCLSASVFADQNPPCYNNRVTNCQHGLEVYWNGYSQFGVSTSGPTYGLNSIHDNSPYNACVGYYYPTHPATLYAECDWWGAYPPNSSLFYVASGSYANFTYSLTADPWSGRQLPAGQAAPGIEVKAPEVLASAIQNTSNNDSPVAQATNLSGPLAKTDSLLAGVGMIRQGNFTGAESFFLNYINHHPDDQAAYGLLYACANSQTTSDIIQFFKSLPVRAAKEQKLLLSNLYLMQGDVAAAKQVDDDLIADNPNTSLGMQATLKNFYIALHNNNNPDAASKILGGVVSNASLLLPMEIADAQRTLATYVAPSTGLRSSRIVSQNNTESVNTALPQTGLIGNYPNPFNPSTKISYSIATNAHVNLTIYDVLGREVKTLVNEVVSSGYHIVMFDASNLASGLYFYRFSALGITQVKKLVVTK